MSKEPKQELKVEVTPAKNRTPWTPTQKGIPVEPGQTWQDLPQSQRQAHMSNHEATWKKRYNTAGGTVAVRQNFTRG